MEHIRTPKVMEMHHEAQVSFFLEIFRSTLNGAAVTFCRLGKQNVTAAPFKVER